MTRPTAELPLLGWTKELHPKFAEYPPQEVAKIALRRISNQGRANRRLARNDVAPLKVINTVIGSAATKKDFTLVQIGAHDGDFDDPLQKYINDHDWRAVLVEPRRKPFERLATRYANNPRVTVINKAVSDSAGKMILWSAVIDGPEFRFGEAIASTNPEQVRREVVRNLGTNVLRNTAIVPEEVEVATVGEVCADAKINPEEVDFFVTDTEGHDAIIVNSLLDSLNTPPPLLQYEHLHVPAPATFDLDQKLALNGMQLVKTHKDTLAFAS